MTVLRIVTNVSARDPRAALPFYGDILGLDLAMITVGSPLTPPSTK